jgi:lipopolysaccharide export system protein LptA
MKLTTLLLTILPLINCLAEIDNNSFPIDISAASGVQVFDSENRLEAYDRLSIVRSDTTIYGNKAVIRYINKDDKRQPRELEVNNEVVTVSPQATIYADQALYDVGQEKLTFLGKLVKLYGLTVNVYAKKSLAYLPNKKQAIARGNVEMEDLQSPQKLFADRIDFFFKDGAQKRQSLPQSRESQELMGALEYVEGHGDVRIVLPGKIATGDHASFRAGKNIIEMWGNVLVTDDNKQLRGEYAVIYKNQGESKVFANLPKHKRPAGAAEDNGLQKRVKIVLLPK